MPRNIILNILKHIFRNKKDFKFNNNQIIAAITHDLKNPVIANIRAIELLLNGVFGNIDDNQKSILNDLLNSNNNILNMLINLLWLYKFDNTKLAINTSVFCFKAVLDEIFKDNKLILNSKYQSFKKLFRAKNTVIEADKMHIKRIINNILMNAILNSLFIKEQVFNQTSDCLSTGLGLYLSNSLLKLNGGEFIYKSTPDKLNTFGFSIPISNYSLPITEENKTLTAG